MSDIVERLLAAMTLEEKLGQLNMIDAGAPPQGADALREDIRAGRVGSVLNVYAEEAAALRSIALEESRLRVPLLFGFDVLHGHRTIFPLPIAEAGAFEPALWERTARAAVEEAGRDGVLVTFAPMLDVCRDPRWGRIAEGPGEDACLAGAYGVAKTRGFQGKDLAARENIAATAKHLGAYGAVEAGRDYGSVDVSERQLAEVYLPPFEAAVKAGVAAIMPSFNDLAGVPMTAHGPILRDLVRGQWGFDGVMVSDYIAVAELIVHGVAEDLADAAALALEAGIDMDMQAQAYVQGMPEALARGRATMAQIDRAARRVLTLKARLGLFDDPLRRVAAPPLTRAETEGFEALAREAARKSIVLLTNDGVLPLAARAKRIALIGPLGAAPLEMFGCWFAAAPLESSTILQGLRDALPQAEIVHVPGVEIESNDTSGIPAALAAARAADVVILSLGETKDMTGEAHSRGRIGLPGRQRDLAEAVLDLGKPTVAVLSHGRPVTAPWLFERANAALATWFLGSQAGNAIADVIIGAHNPSARLTVTWPADAGQIPIFHAQRPTGRPAKPDVYYSSRHTDLPIEPQFPFGHGLSYTRFAVTALRATPAEFSERDTVTVEAEIANEGDRAGEEVVFLFLRDVVASVARPVLELKRFAKMSLAPGARGTVRFTLARGDFVFPGADLRPRVEPGRFEILVGPSADRTRLTATSIRLMDDRTRTA